MVLPIILNINNIVGNDCILCRNCCFLRNWEPRNIYVCVYLCIHMHIHIHIYIYILPPKQATEASHRSKPPKQATKTSHRSKPPKQATEASLRSKPPKPHAHVHMHMCMQNMHMCICTCAKRGPPSKALRVISRILSKAPAARGQVIKGQILHRAIFGSTQRIFLAGGFWREGFWVSLCFHVFLGFPSPLAEDIPAYPEIFFSPCGVRVPCAIFLRFFLDGCMRRVHDGCMHACGNLCMRGGLPGASRPLFF